jgi:uncharacterized membrane protein YfcA
VLAAFVANELPQRVLQLLFVCFALYVAFRMARRALRPEPVPDPELEAT